MNQNENTNKSSAFENLKELNSFLSNGKFVYLSNLTKDAKRQADILIVKLKQNLDEAKREKSNLEQAKKLSNLKEQSVVVSSDNASDKKELENFRNSNLENNANKANYNKNQNNLNQNRPNNFVDRTQNVQGNYKGNNYNPNYKGNNYQSNYNPNNRPQWQNASSPRNPNNPNIRTFTPNNNQNRPQNIRTFVPNQNQGPRPNNFNKKPFAPVLEPASVLLKEKENKFANKSKNKTPQNSGEQRKVFSKKMLLNNFDVESRADEDKVFIRKLNRKKQAVETVIKAPVSSATITTDNITVKLLSESIGKTASEIIKKLFMLGIMATINTNIDFTTASLVAEEMGVTLEQKVDKTFEEKLSDFASNEQDDEKDLTTRPPVVTVMGHVDHGKTSLLDALRKTNVVLGEAGGITQHIGAYTIRQNGKLITFIDTPGHEAFTAMRARGAQITDIAILIVAADDGIMPQTIEAINHIKNANVPMIVAINKMDKPDANPDRIKQQLTEHGILPEEWGGDAIIVEISAKTGKNLDKLIDMILLVAEVQDLKANPNRAAVGTVIEAKVDRGRGPVATVLVQNGTLKIGNTIISGLATGRVRAMIDDLGKNVVSAGPSIAVSILGFDEVPNAGDSVAVLDEKFSKQVIEERKAKAQLEKISSSGGAKLDDFINSQAGSELKTLNVIIKADVQGSLEALKQSLAKISNDEAKVVCIHGGVGLINESDIALAQAANAVILGFNIKKDTKLDNEAEKAGIKTMYFKVIYEALDEIERALKGLVGPKYKEVVIGHAEVRMVFKITGAGIIAGSYVLDGKISRNAKYRLTRNEELVDEGKIESVKIQKDDIKEAREGFECGIKLATSDVKVGDIIEAYILEQITE